MLRCASGSPTPRVRHANASANCTLPLSTCLACRQGTLAEGWWAEAMQPGGALAWALPPPGTQHDGDLPPWQCLADTARAWRTMVGVVEAQATAANPFLCMKVASFGCRCE